MRRFNRSVAVSSASLNKEALQTENWYVRASDSVWKDMVGGYRRSAKEVYRYRRGWISNYPGPAGWNQSMSSSGRIVTAYDSDPEAVTYALTNGAIWTIMGKRDGYVCPAHAPARGGQTPAWSYVMNSRFDDNILYGSFGGASKTVMFAELPFGGGDGETHFAGGRIGKKTARVDRIQPQGRQEEMCACGFRRRQRKKDHRLRVGRRL